MTPSKAMYRLWKELYGNKSLSLLEDFMTEVTEKKQQIQLPAHKKEWYKDAIIYSIYVDLFNDNFRGLEKKLDYLQELRVNCLWLLPILDSPMKDAGFDIRDYKKIRPDLLNRQEDFETFVEKAHKKGIKVIFDIAINHTSEEHIWFLESKNGNPKYRDYYIWNKDKEKYKKTRIIFKGLCESNWEKSGDEYFFHRFFEFQPDLNYRNPEVLLAMTKNFLFWLQRGVDGFRADAIPYLWKEEGTDCENLPKTHAVVKFIRAVLDLVRPNTLLLAEACQKPKEAVKYFGNADECNAAYHFPLMPQMFKALSQQKAEAIHLVLSKAVTPIIPKTVQWLTFLRCHDELSLELVYVSEEDRKYIHDNYCHQPQWNFRQGEGISARLSELMQRKPQKIALAFSVMLTLPGTPVIYYGDEFGKTNDEDYYKEMIKLTGKDDTRFLVRGRVDWQQLSNDLKDKNSLSTQVFQKVKAMVNARQQNNVFGRGELEWKKDEPHILSFIRAFGENKVLVIHNLSDKKTEISLDFSISANDMLGQTIHIADNNLVLDAFAYHWIEL